MTEDRVVIVTGASGALGRAVVADFLDAGMQVVAVARSAGSADLPSSRRLTWASADLLRPDEVRSVVQDAVVRLRHIDALVCLAGGFAGDTPIVETPPERLTEQFELNLMTTYHGVQAVLPHLLERGGGAIIGVGSRPAVEPVPGAVAYAISKLGVVKLMEQLDTEYRDRGIRANCILPSIIDTPANRRAMPDARFERWVRPEQIAAVLRFLVSDAAAAISGATIPVYGRA